MAEKEYIERDAALRVLCDACGNAACPKGLIPRCSYYEKMQSIPAADVRPVVLCRDCKNNYNTCLNHGRNEPMCDFTDRKLKEDDFCSRGEKREES